MNRSAMQARLASITSVIERTSGSDLTQCHESPPGIVPRRHCERGGTEGRFGGAGGMVIGVRGISATISSW